MAHQVTEAGEMMTTVMPGAFSSAYIDTFNDGENPILGATAPAAEPSWFGRAYNAVAKNAFGINMVQTLGIVIVAVGATGITYFCAHNDDDDAHQKANAMVLANTVSMLFFGATHYFMLGNSVKSSVDAARKIAHDHPRNTLGQNAKLFMKQELPSFLFDTCFLLAGSGALMSPTRFGIYTSAFLASGFTSALAADIVILKRAIAEYKLEEGERARMQIFREKIVPAILNIAWCAPLIVCLPVGAFQAYRALPELFAAVLKACHITSNGLVLPPVSVTEKLVNFISATVAAIPCAGGTAMAFMSPEAQARLGTNITNALVKCKETMFCQSQRQRQPSNDVATESTRLLDAEEGAINDGDSSKTDVKSQK